MGRGVRELTHFTPRQERLVRALALASLAYGLFWLHWRWTETLNPDAMVFSVVLAAAETWGWVGAAFFLFTTWKMPRRETQAAPAGKKVDVFITAYNEPLEVLRRTAIGARAIRYPHRTYFLDDGKRDELRQIAAELGIGYIRRVGNANAKAGNLNHALSVTDGEFILQLDADHFPLPHIVDELLGYFSDPKVAFVQTPQDFYNTDSFTHVVNDDARELWEENRIFYSLIQPGKDTHNASFFCGCGGMLRRAALDEIGGFQSQTIVEDMETSIELHRRGWKSVYHASSLAFGLSPASADQFHVQRQRWAQGSMQIMRKKNPLFLPGLTWQQRASYLAANLYPFDGLQKAIFYAAPLVFLLTGAIPIAASAGLLFGLLIPYLVLSITAYELLSRGTGYFAISERYMMAKFFTLIVASLAIVTRKPLRFKVTPKGMSDVPVGTWAPQATVLGVSVVALAWAPFAYANGWVTYGGTSFILAYLASAVWALWNINCAAAVVRMTLHMKQQRTDHRFVDSLPIRYSVEGVPGSDQLASLFDLNPNGLGFRSASCYPPDTRLRLVLPLSRGEVEAGATVVRVEPETTEHGVIHRHGVRFDAMPADVRDEIELHCTQHSVPTWRKRYRQTLDLFARTSELLHNSRDGRRRQVHLAARLRVGDADTGMCELDGMMEEVSGSGARLLVDQPIAPGTTVRFDVPGTSLRGSGQVVFSTILETPLTTRFSVGLRLAPQPEAAAVRPRFHRLWRRARAADIPDVLPEPLPPAEGRVAREAMSQ